MYMHIMHIYIYLYACLLTYLYIFLESWSPGQPQLRWPWMIGGPPSAKAVHILCYRIMIR